MIGPLPIRRLVICTGRPDAAVSRYMAMRFVRAFPLADTRVYYQTGDPRPAGAVPSSATLPIRQLYWSLRTRLKRWPAEFWRYRYFTVCRRVVERRLRPLTPEALPRTEIRTVPSVNLCVDDLSDFRPDLLLISGGGIVAPSILNCARLAVNLHGGKLPEYRGVCSLLFALREGRPDRIGSTLHVAAPRVDRGDVLAWKPLETGEIRSMADLLARLYVSGAEMTSETLRRLELESLATAAQTGSARCFRARDVSATVIRDAYRALRLLRRRPQPALETGMQP